MPDKPYIIGITGNIASGKSVVSQYLQNLGALTIDADVLAQRVISVGAPGFDPVVKAFGNGILDSQGQIDRRLLADIVFSDQGKLKLLEQVIHPFVLAAIDRIMSSTKSPVVVVEAIKLFETGFHRHCDAVWTVAAEDEVRLQRLIHERNLSPVTAQLRLSSQPPQERKIALSDHVIRTDGSFSDTLQQVMRAYASPVQTVHQQKVKFSLSEEVVLAKLVLPDAFQITGFFDRKNKAPSDQEDLCKLLAKNSFWGVFDGDDLCKLISCKQKIGVALINEFHFLDDPSGIYDSLMPDIIHTLQLYMRQNYVEIFILKPGILCPEDVFALNGVHSKINDFEYAYRSVLLQDQKLNDEMISFRLILSDEYNNLFKM
jgi:dephospho-CoA kinase